MDKIKAGYVEGTASIVINAILFAAKIWVSVITGSIALAADAWHTLSDSITSVMVIVASKLSSKKADKKHPFGHGRWEQIASLFIAVVLGIIAYDFLSNSIALLTKQEKVPVEYGTAAIVVTLISIIAKELLAQYAFYIGKKYDNSSVVADGWHHRSDALSSVPVLIGVLFAQQFWWTDGVLGIIVSLVLFRATFMILKETITKILGEEPSQDLINSIKKEITAIHNEDLEVHHFHIHNYISHKEMTFHIRLNKDLNIETGHRIASEIEEMIEKKFDITATIHVEPLYNRKVS
jgi:cation diffusion facilitator family transporter